MTGASDTAV